MQVTSHLVLIIYTGRMSRFFATYETETNISSVSVSKMQTLFQHYSLQPKPEYLWTVFDTSIYIAMF